VPLGVPVGEPVLLPVGEVEGVGGGEALPLSDTVGVVEPEAPTEGVAVGD
jgi:hypothetical protein